MLDEFEKECYTIESDLNEQSSEEPLNLDAEEWQDMEYDSKESKSDFMWDDLSKVNLDDLPF